MNQQELSGACDRRPDDEKSDVSSEDEDFHDQETPADDSSNTDSSDDEDENYLHENVDGSEDENFSDNDSINSWGSTLDENEVFEENNDFQLPVDDVAIQEAVQHNDAITHELVEGLEVCIKTGSTFS